MKKPLFILICVSFILMLVSCKSEEKTAAKEIYIPILTDNSRLESDDSFINGVQLAVEECNAEYSGKGFITRTAVIDDQGQYETGVEMATKAAEDAAVTAVFNLQNFYISETTSGILAGNGKLTLFPYGAYDSLFTQDNPYLFCGVPSFSDLGRVMADYAIEKGYMRIAIYHNGNQSQEELVTAFELELLNAEAKVVDYVPSITSEDEFDSIYSRWQALGVDCVVISQYGLDQAFKVLKMLRGRDEKIPVIGEPIFDHESVLAQNKTIAEGIAVPSTLDIENRDELAAFMDKYKEKLGKEADMWAVQGYDMLQLVVDTAVKQETCDPAKIAQALHDSKGYQGDGRYIAFTSGGALVTDTHKLPMLICRNGMFR